MARNPLTPSRSGFGLLGGGDPFLSLHREMNRLFDEALRGTGLPAGGPSQGGTFVHASMNVSETDKEIRITAELPGVTEQDIDVSLDADVLTIRGEKRFERTDEKENFHFVERSYGTFQRSVRLPYAVDPEQVQAHCENGVLTVTLPKTAQQERSRRIQVQGRGSSSQSAQSGQGSAGGTGGEGGQGGAPGNTPGGASA
jgi:HSP20 family protein